MKQVMYNDNLFWAHKCFISDSLTIILEKYNFSDLHIRLETRRLSHLKHESGLGDIRPVTLSTQPTSQVCDCGENRRKE